MDWILSVDNAILDFIQQNLRSPLGDTLMVLFTKLGDAGILWIALGLGLLCFRKTRKMGVGVLSALVFNLILCNLVMKPLFGRIRPYEANGFAGLLIPPPSGSSFPSGHTSASFAAVTALFCHRRWLGALMLIPAVLIAFSRLYLYVHYPSDVFIGALLGAISALLACWIVNRIWKKYAEKQK